MDKLPLTSKDILAEKIERIREEFPEVFSEGKIDFERLKMALGDFVDNGRERYRLTWAGKSEAIRNIQTPSVGTLLPVPEESVNFETSENLIIEGDNLEVLKLLQKSYHGKIKMIYIDPPYNTGNEFIYPDNFREGLDDYLRYSGQVDGDGIKLSTNTETDGRFHSKWLNMMYPRLFLARNLLREDGVIFVSIDDNEIHNLRILMNELFGEENFIATFVWKRRTGSNDSKNFVSSDHEYLVAYARTEFTKLNGILKDFANYSNPDNDPRGPWAVDNLTCNKTADERPNLFYPITDPATGITYQCNPNRVWAYEKERMLRLIDEGKVIFPRNGQGTPYYKRHKSELRSERKPVSTWIEGSSRSQNDVAAEQFDDDASILQVPLNSHGTKELRAIFDSQVFNYPKSSRLIRTLIEQATSDNDIVLDFFAGSGTTAHAVLDLNHEDGGNRKFILIQLPEPTGIEEFPTIADVAKERVRRVIRGTEQLEALGGDFKVFRLSDSNFKVWNGTGEGNVENLARQLKLFADNIRPGRESLDLLYEILLKSGLPLSATIEQIDISGQRTFSIANGALLICLGDSVNEQYIQGVLGMYPRGFVCLDASFNGNDNLKTNTKLLMESHGIEFHTV
ncbi:site-specific DNA-methyltransferase [Alicyclobacillus tolerans]|uniref:Adenine-specific DNA-methyltransferase n=1 Tax=Alicyclobacillus tolerans TaxID=90970 RepID=A0ABT9LZK1_9BACL|nr:site-specific DNA-methyltransferase [Alicyclobacillus tengchongensis]MDP9729680.1 adenine-specific DNA-methyltransferase [Alicyclobacillus tengchongensis]